MSVKTECLDHFVVCGEKHLLHLLSSYNAHYHTERPHQSMGNRPLSEQDEEADVVPFPGGGEVKCRERLGGLLKHYYREAA